MPTLEKIDIAAMKQANAIVFRTKDGVSQIECIRRKSEKHPFEDMHIIKIDVAYAKEAVCVLQLSDSDLAWQSIVRNMKVGDGLRLRWYQGAWNTPALEGAGFVGDALWLEWQRGKQCYKFLITVEINNHHQYRMVRQK